MWTSLAFLLVAIFTVEALKPCPGDTRGDKRCNHDDTHRVCAKIGVEGTSFWKFTGQKSWCGTKGYYGGPNGSQERCPKDEPTWCICKWATAKWIKGQGCDDTVQFDCEATDVCNLKASYDDFKVDLKPAHDCMAIKCKEQWDACPDSRSSAAANSASKSPWIFFVTNQPKYRYYRSLQLIASEIVAQWLIAPNCFLNGWNWDAWSILMLWYIPLTESLWHFFRCSLYLYQQPQKKAITLLSTFQNAFIYPTFELWF